MGLHKKDDAEAELKLTTCLRVGGTGPNKSTNIGNSFFDGELCHFAVYDTDLHPDRVFTHYISGTQERGKESERLFMLAAEKFKDALCVAPNDPVVLKRYAESVCQYVQADGASLVNVRRTKNKVAYALGIFHILENFDAMAEILMRLPIELEFSDTACEVFDAIIEARPDYFNGGYITTKELAVIPNKYLLYESTKKELVETSAKIYQTVMGNPALVLFYGDDDLSFIRKIRNPKAIISLVKQVHMGIDKRIVDINMYRDCTDLDDEDLRTIADYRRAATVMNVRDCKALTDASFRDVARFCNHLQAVTIDGCSQLSNDSINAIMKYCKGLNQLSIERCPLITNSPIISLVETCTSLRALTFNSCTQLTDDILGPIAKNCRQLELLHISLCFLFTDEGMYALTSGINRTSLTSLDLSGCKGLTDDGFEVVAMACISLKWLNLSSARITDIGMRAITHNCWRLKNLIMKDLYLISDDVFFFDLEKDGRKEADENMLTSLTELDLTDCTRLTDRALEGLSIRCENLVNLKLGGCSNLTDRAIDLLLKEPKCGKERGKHLTKLSFAFCTQMTDQGISKICQACAKIDTLDLSGLVHLTDEVMKVLAEYCPHLQNLSLARCKRLTDKTLCTLADYLWIEELDISHCNKITDEGLEVIALEFTGLKKLNIAWLQRVTDRTLSVLGRSCKVLASLDISECIGMKAQAIREIQEALPNLKILKDDKLNQE